MMQSRKTLLYCCFMLLLCSCATEEPDYSIRRPAALSLPEIRRDSLDAASGGTDAVVLTVPEAVKRSKLVLYGSLKSVDSTGFRNQLPLYLVGVQASRGLKGHINDGQLLYYMTRKRPAVAADGERLYFLSAADTSGIMAGRQKISWQWTFGAPENAGAADVDQTALQAQGTAY